MQTKTEIELNTRPAQKQLQLYIKTLSDVKCVDCTHGEQGQGLARALQQAVNGVWVSWVEGLLQESLLHHQLHELLPPVHCLQHPQARHYTHQQHKLLPRHILQHLRRQQGRETISVCSGLFLHRLTSTNTLFELKHGVNTIK